MNEATSRLESIISDQGLDPNQQETLRAWVTHLRTFKKDIQILDKAYTLREFGLFIKKPFNLATPTEIDNYLLHKSKRGDFELKEVSLLQYQYRINWFYRWVLNHSNPNISPDLAYPKPKIERKPRKTREELCKVRINAILNNEIIPRSNRKDQNTTQDELKQKYSHLLLDEANLKSLTDFYNYKTTSGLAESNTGYVGKIGYLKRLGLFLKNRQKNFIGATREDIQDFLSEVQKGVKRAPEKRMGLNSTYKAYLLDFYRFVYGYPEDEQPRKYPPVVAWLYQGKKKSHDKIAKEIIRDAEIKKMIDACPEIRDKAVIALFSDSSARIGELVNICIKDLKINEIASEGAEFTHAIATVVLRGKTGERTNQLFYSVPYLRLWLLGHPLKDDPNAPMFISTRADRTGQRLTTYGITNIIERAANRAGVTRHIHAHLFRHTNLTRMAKLLSESELKIHAGWGSNSPMAEVYVHLTEKDVANKILEKYGIIQKTNENQDLFEIHICPNTTCSYQNPHEAKFCLKCGYPLTLETAITVTKIKKMEDGLQNELLSKDLAQIKTVSGDVKEQMYQILKTDPQLMSKLKEIIELTSRNP